MKVYPILCIVAAFALIPSIYKSCKPLPAQIDKVEKKEASAETKKLVPDAKTEIQVKNPKPVIGKTPIIKIVEKTNGEVVQVVTYKSDMGWFKGLGLFASADLSGFNGGLDIGTLYYDRFCLDVLGGIKSAGPGISAQILKNTSIGGSYTYRYENLLPTAGVFVKMTF